MCLSDAPSNDLCPRRALLLVPSIGLLAVLSAEANDLVEIRVVGKDPECVVYAVKGAEWLQLATQLGHLVLEFRNSLFKLFECHHGLRYRPCNPLPSVLSSMLNELYLV